MVVHLLEVAARVLLVYLFLLALLRLLGRRTMSQLRPIDLLTMLLLSETVSPALTGGDSTLAAGVVAAGMLGLAAMVTSWLSYQYRWFDYALDGPSLLLIKNGVVDSRVMKSQRITAEELRSALHAEGVLAVSQVKKAFVEPDGSITIVKQ